MSRDRVREREKDRQRERETTRERESGWDAEIVLFSI